MTDQPLAVSRPLSLRLLRRVLALSAAVILALGLVRGWWEYQEGLRGMETAVESIRETHAQGMAEALWEYDRAQLSFYVAGILSVPHVTYAAVLDGSTLLAQAGHRMETDVLERDIPLVRAYNGEPRTLGVLRIQADLASARRMAGRTALRAVLFNSVVALAMALLVFFLTRQMVSRHISVLAEHFRIYDPGGPPLPLALDKIPVGDELDVLAKAVNTMQAELSASFERLQASRLESRVLGRFPEEDPNPVMRVTPDGRLSYANPASRHLLGKMDTAEGLSLPQDHAAVVAEALATGFPQRFEATLGDRTFAFIAQPVLAEGFVNVYGMDISRRVRAEEEVRLAMRRLEGLVRVLQHQDQNLRDFLDYCLAEALALTGSLYGYIYHYSEARGEFTLNSWSRQVMDDCAIAEKQTLYHLDKTGIWGEAVRQRRPLILNDFQAPHPLKMGYPEGHARITRFLTVPVLNEGRIVAVAGVANKAEPYTEADAAQLGLLMEASWKEVSRLEALEGLRRSLHEKEILLKEIHHRVKNNLQVISSLLYLQAEHVLEPLDRAMFAESQKRIQAMALVHEELYGSGDLASVDMREYIPRLVDRVALGAQSGVRTRFALCEAKLPVTRSIPCGLLLNELVMNAVKHAFPPLPKGEGVLGIRLAVEDGDYVLSVEDNGPGLPPDFSLDAAETLGMTLVTSLAQQLGGAIRAENMERGARFTLRFPVEGQ